MLAILNSLNALNFPIFQLILLILVSKFMVQRALSDKTYLLLGLLSPLMFKIFFYRNRQYFMRFWYLSYILPFSVGLAHFQYKGCWVVFFFYSHFNSMYCLTVSKH